MNQRIEYYNRILQKKPIYKQIVSSIQTNGMDELLYITVFMPVLIEYISWVLQEAMQSGKRRLYFLARDGYQMYLVAKKLCEAKSLPIECRYLKVSRYAMRMPEYHLLEEKCIDNICIGGIDVTIARMMQRAGLTDAEVIEILPDRDYHKLLNYQEVMQLKEVLKKQPKFLEYVYQHSKESYEPAMAYLRQEGLFEDVPYALVDSGWVGTLQKSIANLVGKDDLEGFYFGMYETPKDRNPKQYHAFYFSPRRNIRRKVHFSNCLFEAVFTSPDGMTLSYEKKEGSYIPVSDFHKNPNQEQINCYCALLETYMNLYIKEKEYGQPDVLFVDQLLKKCMGYPTQTEVEAFGNLLFSDDVLEGNLKKVAADLTLEEIRTQRFWNKARIMLGLKKEEIHESAWIEGSIVKADKDMAKNLRHAKWYKYFVYIRKLWK